MRIKRMYLIWCMFLVPLVQYAQITVQGVVTDTATQDPLPGVSVIIKGTNQGTATDFDGNYLMEANMGDTLVFTYIGFQPKEVVVSGSTLNVTLDEDTTLLDEVVVIGYGTTTVKDATGSVQINSLPVKPRGFELQTMAVSPILHRIFVFVVGRHLQPTITL